MTDDKIFQTFPNAARIMQRVIADPELKAFFDELTNVWREHAEKEKSAERERCAGILRSMIRYASANGTNRDECIALMRTALSGLDPSECKVSLSREQETLDAIAEAEMNMRERCANIAATYFDWHKPEFPEYCDGDPAEDIAAKIRSGE